MKRINVRCWKVTAGCVGEHQQPVYFTVPDFGDSPHLYICPKCGALFAVDPDAEQYSRRNFEEEKNGMRCPECQNGLSNLLSYPDSYRNEATGEIEHFERAARTIPPDDQAIILELWDPLS